MPIYTFENPETGETDDLYFGINDDKVFVDDGGVTWRRVFIAPNISVNSGGDPFSKKDFIEKTSDKGTYGDLMDRSRDMSEKRKDKLGYDPMRQKYFKEYSSKRGGSKHHLDR
jgi:predicted nucleic acid-binding Zn ribbon protein